MYSCRGLQLFIYRHFYYQIQRFAMDIDKIQSKSMQLELMYNYAYASTEKPTKKQNPS